MHELSIALNIIDLAQAEGRRLGAPLIIAVHVRVGPLSGVVAEALHSAFEIAREGTVLASTRLIVDHAPILVACPACAAETTARSLQQLVCSNCGGPPDSICGGDELEMVAIEIEESGEPADARGSAIRAGS